MSLRNWLQRTPERVKEDGLNGLAMSGRHLYSGAWRVVCSRLPIGTNVYEREWDVLVLLDGCRVDLLSGVADEYAFLDNRETLRSVGSTSREWLAKTFVDEYSAAVSETVYVTANPYTDEILAPGGAEGNNSPFNPANWSSLNATSFQSVEEVWRDRWDDSLGTVPPRRVTDRTISVDRDLDPKRLIVHYMQPHQPFLGILDGDDEPPDWARGNLWHALQRGDVSRSVLWDAYEENLRLVLDEVALLRENLDADRMIISSDHGNALGEWGIYGHPNGFPHPAVKRVPWVRTSAEDNGSYEPTTETGSEPPASVTDRLEDLGYL